MSVYKNIICDVDGTILNSMRDIMNAQLFMLNHFGLHTITEKDILPYYGKPVHEMMMLFLPKEEHHRLQESVEVYRNYYKQHWFDTSSLFPGVQETLTKLFHRNIRFATATTKSTGSSCIILEHFGVAQYFSQIQGTDSGFPYKPDPFIINKVLTEQSWKREETMIIGDSHSDILAGKNAGIATCGVTYGCLTRAEIEKSNPDFIITTFSELDSLIA